MHRAMNSDLKCLSKFYKTKKCNSEEEDQIFGVFSVTWRVKFPFKHKRILQV